MGGEGRVDGNCILETQGRRGWGEGSRGARLLKSQLENAGEERMRRNGWSGEGGLKCKFKAHGRKGWGHWSGEVRAG